MASHANPVNWFEIPVNDLARAKTFYETVFEIPLTDSTMGPNKMAWFPMDPQALGAAGTLVQGDGYEPSHSGTLVYLHVDSLDPTLEKISNSGGKILMPRTDISGYGYIAHFEDTEGNRVGVHESPVMER